MRKYKVLLDSGQEEESSAKGYIQNETDLQNGVLSIQSSINEDLWRDIIRPLKQMEHDPDVDLITIYLNTPGGDLEIAMAFCNIIDSISKSTALILFGEVWSAGMLMACSGHHNPNVTTYCLPSTLGVLHQPALQVYEESLGYVELTELLDVLNRKSQMMRDYIISHTAITPEEYDEKVTHKELYLTAQELVEYGIVDEIITGEQQYVFL